MTGLYTRAFCRDCRLHFEYARAHDDQDVIVPCPQCDKPAKHGPFQPCDRARFERIEAEYERLAHQAEAKRFTQRSKGKRWSFDDEDEYYLYDRKRRRR